MKKLRHSTLGTFGFLMFPSLVLACAWDYDTLMMERVRFPDTLEIITGKFLRHSKEFYEWRIRDRLRKIKEYPDNLSFYDDLGVAYDKTGQHDKAIETMLRKEKIKSGLYETEANLGTFYIHAGQLEKGLEHIDHALRINPDAHFGREKYQKMLVQYLLTHQKGGKIELPLTRLNTSSDPIMTGKEKGTEVKPDFLTFLGWEPHSAEEQVRKKAIKGVSGMVKFGNHDSPILMEILGNLLSRYGYDNGYADAKQLAARAYLRASFEVADKKTKAAYREMAKSVLEMQLEGSTKLTLDNLEKQFEKERKEADAWYATLRNNELKWIKSSPDPDLEFATTYYEEPRILPIPVVEPWWSSQGKTWAIILLTGSFPITLLGIFWIKRRRTKLLQPMRKVAPPL